MSRPFSLPRALAACGVSFWFLFAWPAAATGLRVPQIAFASAPLQHYITDYLGDSVHVATDQLAAQVFPLDPDPLCFFSIRVLRSVGASVGIYNTLSPGTPELFELFPWAAGPGWRSNCRFLPSNRLVVELYDQNDVLEGTVSYAGADRAHFGFYVRGPGGTWYSQDARNGNAPQVLIYAGTQAGSWAGTWWVCLEDSAYDASTSTFFGSVIEYVPNGCTVVPVHTSTWGNLKARYR